MNILTRKLNLLVTLDQNYLPYLNVMLCSVIRHNPELFFNVFLLHTEIPENAFEDTVAAIGQNGKLFPIQVNDLALEDAPTSSRYPTEIYYRIFAAKYLPRYVDRVLYLDPDLIVNGPLTNLYETDLHEYYFAAASHTGPLLQKISAQRLGVKENFPYINSGVMLMNIKLLREEQNYDDVFHFIYKRKSFLVLPDQDVISALYGSKIYALDAFRYNMTEKLFRQHSMFERGMNLEWVRRNSLIIHYCGRNKPWKPRYSGQLDVFYNETLAWAKQNGRIAE